MPTSWFLSAVLPVGADEDTEPRLVGALMQRETGWFAVPGEGKSSVSTALEMSVSDAHVFALDLLRTVTEIEAGMAGLDLDNSQHV